MGRSRLQPTANTVFESSSGDFSATQSGNSFPGRRTAVPREPRSHENRQSPVVRACGEGVAANLLTDYCRPPNRPYLKTPARGSEPNGKVGIRCRHRRRRTQRAHLRRLPGARRRRRVHPRGAPRVGRRRLHRRAHGARLLPQHPLQFHGIPPHHALLRGLRSGEPGRAHHLSGGAGRHAVRRRAAAGHHLPQRHDRADLQELRGLFATRRRHLARRSRPRRTMFEPHDGHGPLHAAAAHQLRRGRSRPRTRARG